tara:strand:+ start:2478 stop:3209 length:732 start_codon:yes stop_codon:yes gene_type:complete
MANNNFKIVIPARYRSTRLPGKPLIDVLGKTILERTVIQCNELVEMEKIVVLTDSNKIFNFCHESKIPCKIVDENCKTGTDRISLYTKNRNLDFVINVQGDEPLIEPSDIEIILNQSLKNNKIIYNGYKKINTNHEFINPSIPKVVFDKNYSLLYMSRSGIPSNKDLKFILGYKQVCVYSYPLKSLELFQKNPNKGMLEEQEDIEILRFLEFGERVKMVELFGDSFSIDTNQDLLKLNEYLKR